MLYTVKDLSKLGNVTIKTLHHYHKIGLLLPEQISHSGYRLYGRKELERLQHILFYRALDFPLKEIKKLLDSEPDRLSLLLKQKALLLERMRRTEQLVRTINESITFTEKGAIMDESQMFKGFQSEEEWKKALEEQSAYLKENYGVDLMEEKTIDIQEMNVSAQEATSFIQAMAQALTTGVKFDDEHVQRLMKKHIEFLNSHGHETQPEQFAQQSRFFLNDDFHRNMLEDQQTGLSYYLCIAAETFAAHHTDKI
ncbi:DNA-binding transcriptional MerR regulator [Pullulanibacillus pueri]|uniref:MerR family transcriptional regulator n=1 Tax=Pullulanibacillus pueri TaxID=1437324 RepID=A0A8J2ZTZ2_9BACL|nr:MerR family transcriptional regulator [Pullulanibacillus pueri]MBM7681308.1 DNA-binding transcriptional MerR regulator [Pullulanibacillus pueri]GGH77651.1 MerR family transcriptional regulator [Pullulanibacillus pueri]